MLFNAPQVSPKMPGFSRIKLPADKRQRILLFVSVVAILGIILVFYFGSGSSAPSNSLAVTPINSASQIAPTSDSVLGLGALDVASDLGGSTKAKLNLNDLDNLSSRADFKSLKSFTDLTKPFGLNTERGRSNPFLPY